MTPANPNPSAPTTLDLPVLPLKNTALLPFMFMPLSVGRPNSLAAVEAALAGEDKTFVVVAQRDPNNEQPTANDLYRIGTRAVVKRMARTEQVIELLVQGAERVTILNLVQVEPYLKGRVQPVPLPDDTGPEIEAIYRAVLDLARRALELTQTETPVNIDQLAAQAGDPLRMVYLLGSMLSLDVQKEQALLEAATRMQALQLLHGYLTHEVQVLELRAKIASKAQTEMRRSSAITCSGSRCVPSRTSWAKPAPKKPTSSCCDSDYAKQTSQRTCARRPSANWSGWSGCPAPHPITS